MSIEMRATLQLSKIIGTEQICSLQEFYGRVNEIVSYKEIPINGYTLADQLLSDNKNAYIEYFYSPLLGKISTRLELIVETNLSECPFVNLSFYGDQGDRLFNSLLELNCQFV